MTTVVSERLDTALVRRGLARSRARAAELVQHGAVEVEGSPARKPSQPVADTDVVRVLQEDRYVSRGAHKLIGALDDAAALAPGRLRVAGRRCLDAGASTGGFTQVLLERGADHVQALDVGHGQLAPVLRLDPRVTAVEGVNVRDLTPKDAGPEPGLVVADLSFISLTLVVPALVRAAPDADLLLMVKPQFEVGRTRLGSGGVVVDPALRTEAVLTVAARLQACGARVVAVLPSRLPGEHGNAEYFLWAVTSAPGHGEGDEDLPGAVALAVSAGRPVLVKAPA